MWDTIAVILVLLVTSYFGIRRLVRTFSRSGGCQGGRCCQGKQSGASQSLELTDLRKPSDV